MSKGDIVIDIKKRIREAVDGITSDFIKLTVREEQEENMKNKNMKEIIDNVTSELESLINARPSVPPIDRYPVPFDTLNRSGNNIEYISITIKFDDVIVVTLTEDELRVSITSDEAVVIIEDTTDIVRFLTQYYYYCQTYPHIIFKNILK